MAFIGICVKGMQHSVKNGREYNRHDKSKHDDADEAEGDLKKLAGRSLRFIWRADAGNHHGRIQGGIEPAQAFDVVVSLRT